ncbi:SRPBCC domain-containing protein [Streptomyces poriticola]|uniref:SRPBCC domain-containing protein n=1 Tax=Streptomyces poriticola TaxID=3120506 RepID=UPI002FCE32D5
MRRCNRGRTGRGGANRRLPPIPRARRGSGGAARISSVGSGAGPSGAAPGGTARTCSAPPVRRALPAQSPGQPGSRWAHVRTDGSGVVGVVGVVEVSERPHRLVTTWAEPGDEERSDRHSRVTFDIRRHADIVRLTVTHENLAGETERAQVAVGWPAALSNLKSMPETGSPLAQEPWLVPSD